VDALQDRYIDMRYFMNPAAFSVMVRRAFPLR
jgi:hypothetical protein